MKRLIFILSLVFVLPAAADWPTYGHDNRRSHVTTESLEFPLEEIWIRRSPIPPQTAWTGPAKWDAFASNDGLQSMRNFDPVFFVTAAADRVYFGSSVDDAAHCLDAETGEEIWVAFADSAVRLPPTIADGKAWFGADDGLVYCVSADDGTEIWRYRAVENPKMIPSNGKLISPWPIRTGVMIESGVAWFGSSLFPWESSFLCAVDAKTGEPRFVEEQSKVTLQGALLASAERIYAPQGRAQPLVFAKKSGVRVGEVTGSGGVWCILTEHEELISMPKNQKEKEETVKLTVPGQKESILSIPAASRMIASGERIFVHQRGALKALDRNSPKQPLWTSSCPAPAALILAGEHIFLGGDGIVSAFEAETGKPVWSAEIPGRVYGLAVANGRLFASTDHGHIVAFGQAN